MRSERRRIWNDFIVVVLVTLLVFVSVGCACAAEIYVPDAYEKIQWAVDYATAGDTIIVRDGTYAENVAVNKPLTIRSQNGAAFTTAFSVTVDYVNISGFTVISDIKLVGVNHCAISNISGGIFLDSSSNNTLTGNTGGIDLGSSSNNNTLTGNTGVVGLDSSSNNNLTGNTGHIYLYSSSYNTLTGNAGSISLYSSSNYNTLTSNNASNNDLDGILLDSSSYNTLTGNNASNNDGSGILLDFASNNTLTGNNASNNNDWGILLEDSSNNTLTGNNASNNSYGIWLYFASNNTLTGNNASDNDYHGIWLYFASNNNLTGNNASNNNGSGIYLSSSSNSNNLTGNNASNNSYGIRLSSSSNNNLTGNTANSNNIYGIRLSSSSNDNHIYNNFFDNTINAYDDGINMWNITKTEDMNIIGGPNLGGNYWSDYTGNDTDGDLLGDTLLPYNCSGNITLGGDYHPLVICMIAINHTTSTYKFIPTPCQNATINFTIKPALIRDSPEINVSMIIKDKKGTLVYNSSEDVNAQVNKTTAIWIGKNTTGEIVDPRLSNYTVEILVKYRNITMNDTHNITVLPNKVIVVADEERMKALYNDNDVDNLMADLGDYCCRNNGTLYNLTKVRHDFDADPGYNDAFTYQQLHQWLHYPYYVERKLENVTKFMTQNNNVSILLVGNDNVIPYHRINAIINKLETHAITGPQGGGYNYTTNNCTVNILWSDFPYSEITGDNNSDVPVTRLEGNPDVMMKQLESTETQYRGTKALLAIKWGSQATQTNHNFLRLSLTNEWGFGANVFYYNETFFVSIADIRIDNLSYLDRFNDDNVVMYAAAHGNDYMEAGQNVQVLGDDNHKEFLYPNNVSLGTSHPLFVTKACHGACTYPGDTSATSIPIALLADGAVGFVGWRTYGPTIEGADFFSNYYFPRLRVKDDVGSALMNAKNEYLVAEKNNTMSQFIARAGHHYGVPDYVVHVPNDPSNKGYSLTIDTCDNTTTINMTLFSYDQSVVETEEGNRTLFTIPGAHVLDNEGDYVIPEIVEIIATLPPTLDLEQLLSTTKSDMETITDIKLPVSVWLFEKDDALYAYSGESLNLPGLYPQEVIDYEVIEKVDGKRTVYFRIFPFQYNDSANEMYVYRNITSGFVTGPAEPKPPVRLLVTNDFESEIPAGASTVVGMFIDNYGTGDAKNVTITEEIPVGFNVTLVSTGGTVNTSANIITWEIQSIGSEDFKMLNYELVAPQTAGNYTINTTIEYTDEKGTIYPAINISKAIYTGEAPAPAPPTITSFAPPSPVRDTVCNWRTFNVTVNQTVNVSWYLNDSLFFTNESVMEASYRLHAEVAGEHKVSAIATNANGTAMQTWLWNVVSEAVVFDTDSPANPYPSICGVHNGTITPNQTIIVHKLYTYPCPGTGGHTEYAAISYQNGTVLAEAQWNGYVGDWHNLTFNKTFTLYANETYNYTIRTGSYPQIIHKHEHNATGGVITCSEFVDVNGKRHEEWIPAITLWSD